MAVENTTVTTVFEDRTAENMTVCHEYTVKNMVGLGRVDHDYRCRTEQV